MLQPDIIHHQQHDEKGKLNMERLDEVYKKWSKSGPGETRVSNQNIQGKEAWLNKFGELPTRKRRTKGPAYSVALDLVPEVVNFKTKPPPPSYEKEQRTFKGRCCPRCSPLSREVLYNENIPDMGLCNVLRMPLENRTGVVSYLLPNLNHIMKRNKNHIYPTKDEMISKVSESGRVHTAIQNCAILDAEGLTNRERGGLSNSEGKHGRRLKRILGTMVAKISCALLKVTSWVLLRVLGVFLLGVQVHKGQMELIKEASKKGVPLVFIPMHRSHLDYVLLSFILHNYGVKAPHIAAGDNLNLPVFSWVLRSLGAFFIKRKLDRDVGKKDLVYRAALHTYIEEVLQSNQNLEFFIEGGRSRSGKALSPKGGLLSCVVDSYYDGVISDAFIVPASISYEKILDGHFNNEQMGLQKRKETFMMALRGIYDVLKHNYGHVKVDFAQPFSLKEYLEAPQAPATPVSDIATSGICKSKVKRAGSDNSLYGTDIVVEDTRQLVKGLAEHIVYDSVHVNTIMSTNIVAFLLLTKFREGIAFNTLVKELDKMKEGIASRGYSIGFTGTSTAIVHHAIRLLGGNLIRVENVVVTSSTGPDVISNEKSNKEKEFVTPLLSLPNVFELSYYSNTLISVFLMESVLANAIIAECGSTQLMFNTCHSSPLSICKDRLLTRAMQLCDLLQFEFIFAPPCGNLTNVINDAIEELAVKGVITVKDSITGFKDQRWVRQLAATTGWESDESDSVNNSETIEINMSSENKKQLQFLQCVLGPLIEGYWLSVCNLVRLLDMDVDDNTYIRMVNMYAKERVEKGFAVFSESCSMDTLRNAVKVFLHWKVLCTYYDAENIKMLQLKEPYRDEAKLSVLIDKIEVFRV
ncbi:glycerol-3-phosphate acyltransferase 1, mitochondrial-like [Antedon mediterranea]|uniref:glycerol-3-phosphate acyltransferase 1, mitochondrial-like n=1 Tax=Antedon mediterranea TaxID=105859 RepID=UPI003AF9676E